MIEYPMERTVVCVCNVSGTPEGREGKKFVWWTKSLECTTYKADHSAYPGNIFKKFERYFV